jgi:hypothetical protein
MAKIASNFYFNLNVIKQISQKLKPRSKKQRQKDIRQIFK